jgi:CHAT domain-containing protein
LESQLQNLLQKAVIARARDENEAFQTLIGQAGNFAKMVDTGTQNHYWSPFVDEVGGFTKEHAVSWLKAKRAEWLCRLYHDTASKITDAECYASLGLKFLQQVKDDRVQLDIIQRLQWILQRHHSMQELSIALAQKSLPQADSSKYHLRSNGLILVEADARSKMGQPQAALALYLTVFGKAEKFKQINGMDWFTKNSLLKKAEAHRELGEFEKAWEACREAEKQNLNQTETIVLQIAKYYILLETAHYEQAEKELEMAMAIAEKERDHENYIACLINFGHLNVQLTEYDLALAYFKQAQALFTDSSPSLSMRLLVLGNIADRLAAKRDSVQFEKIIQEAQGYLRLTHSPFRQAILFFSIGEWHRKAKKYSMAITYYQKADSIYYQSDYLRQALATRIFRIDCLIALSRFSEAKILLAEIEMLAKGINDIERLIDVYDRVAQIQYHEGNVSQAVASSNRLLPVIEELSTRFSNPARLIAYRQKVYDFLKYAVLYEIALQHQDAAFAKLDRAKAYVLKSQLLNGHADHYRQEANANHLTLDFVKTKFPEKSLLLDYMITPDTLYVFMLDQGRMQLLRKKIDVEALRQTTNAYRDSINKTLRLFQHYNAQHAKAHYAGTVALGQQLYQDLLGWPEIDARLLQTERLYIVPDEFLYEIPFSTLMANRSEVQTFLMNRSAVLTLPSVSLLANENLADGTHEQRIPQKVLMSVDKRFPGAEQFVATVQALFPLAEELTVPDRAFTKEMVLAQLQKDKQVYIFLGHGQANPQYPDYGYIELSVKTPRTSPAKIMRLTVADLKTINWLGAEMVMLVGCETASGRLYRGTGIAGLQQELLSLGARNVLGNLWEVDATHAIAQAQDFLTAWVTTGNPSRALQASQSRVVQTLQGHHYYQQPHPYFWGSAVLLTTTSQ